MKREISLKPHVDSRRGEGVVFRTEEIVFPCMTSPGRIFMDCLSLSSSASKLDNDEDDNVIDNEDHSSQISGCCSVGNGGMRRERPSLSGCSNRIANGFSFGGDQRQARCGSRRICSCHIL